MPKKPVYFYPPAEQAMADIWCYSSQWGEGHADQYTADLYNAIEEKRKAPHHQIFPKNKAASIYDEELYYFHWKQKQRQNRGHTIFYRKISNNNIGIVAILGDSMDKTVRLREALENIEQNE